MLYRNPPKIGTDIILPTVWRRGESRTFLLSDRHLVFRIGDCLVEQKGFEP